MGWRTDHMPLRTLSQDAVPQAPFLLHSSHITVHPCHFCFPSPSSFPYSERLQCNATCCHLMPPTAVQRHPPFPLIPTATMLPMPLLPLLLVSMPPHTPTTAAAFATLSPRSCHCCLRARPSSGNVKTISGQFKRSDLCVEHRLNVRTPPLAWPVHASPQLTLWRLDSHEIYARSILGSRTSFPPFFHGAKPSSYILFRTATFPQADHLFIYPVSGKCTTYPSAGQSGCRSFIRHLRIH